jgi:DNA-binding LacI/PurR family transcriptional regulator
MVTSKEVAKLAGVSISTVSRVFSRPDKVNEKTKEKVLRIAEELHYIPDITAKSLKLNKSNIIGMVIPDISNPFYLLAAKELSNTGGYERKFYITFSQENATNEFNSIVSLIGSKVDIIIFTPVNNSNESVESYLNANNVPAIQVYRRMYDNLDSLVIDDAYGTYLATKELLKNGHKDIVLFDYNLSIPTHREEGYIKAFKEFGLEYNKDMIIKSTFDDDFYSVIKEAIETKKPTGVIPCGILYIDALRKYLRNNGVKIKKDISIVSYDDTDISKALNLTTISHPFMKITESINNIINTRLSNTPTKVIHSVIKPFLISRDSIAKIN